MTNDRGGANLKLAQAGQVLPDPLVSGEQPLPEQRGFTRPSPVNLMEANMKTSQDLSVSSPRTANTSRDVLDLPPAASPYVCCWLGSPC